MVRVPIIPRFTASTMANGRIICGTVAERIIAKMEQLYKRLGTAGKRMESVPSNYQTDITSLTVNGNLIYSFRKDLK